mgnify:CR=1 FL=1
MEKRGRELSDTVWTRLDRKAGAIVELTIRQLSHRISTWVVLGVGVLLMALLMTFYIDGVRESFEPIDNDGDSEDYDGDGYPLGQERKYGTPDWDPQVYPGSSQFVYENEIDWNDRERSHYDNRSWDGFAFFEMVWVDSNYSGEWWDWHVTWNIDDDTGVPQLEDCSDWDLEQLRDRIWGEACDFGDLDGNGLTTYFVGGKWRGEGLAIVPENYYLQWGYWTEEVYIEPEPREMYVDEDGIDCFTDSSQNRSELTRVDCPAESRLSGSHGFDDDGDDGGAVGHHHRGQPDIGVPALPGRGAGTAEERRAPHRQYRIRHGPLHRLRPAGLLRVEGRASRADPRCRQGHRGQPPAGQLRTLTVGAVAAASLCPGAGLRRPERPS